SALASLSLQAALPICRLRVAGARVDLGSRPVSLSAGRAKRAQPLAQIRAAAGLDPPVGGVEERAEQRGTAARARRRLDGRDRHRSEGHTSELQSRADA